MRRFALLFCLLAAPVWAQTSAGTLTWTHTRPTDLSSYKLAIDGAAAVSIGLPATNSTPVTLAVGAHSLVLSACYVDTTCVASTPYAVTVTVTPAANLTYTLTAPADNVTINLNTPITMSVTTTDDSGILSVTLQWSVNGAAYTNYSTTKSGDSYSHSLSPNAGSGPRTWRFLIKAKDGEQITTAPVRTVNVVIP